MQPIRALIFDVDGTMAETEEVHRGAFNRAVISDAFLSTLRTTGMIYVVIIGALVFATFISTTGITEALSGAVTDFHASPVVAITGQILPALDTCLGRSSRR